MNGNAARVTAALTLLLLVMKRAKRSPDVKRKRLPITIAAIPRTYYHCNIAHCPETFDGAITTNAQHDYRDQSLDLIRFLATKPWAGRGHNRWDHGPRIDADLAERFAAAGRWAIKPKALHDDGSRNYLDEDDLKMDTGISGDLSAEIPKNWAGSTKRSAVATALNGRRRRQPAPPPVGKEVTPYVGVGVLNDMNLFFDNLRDNLENLVSLSPEERANLFTDAPAVVRAPSSGGGGGGIGMRRLHALRPLRPTNIRTYNRRSFVEADDLYPGANHHDPGLLWTGLGRR